MDPGPDLIDMPFALAGIRSPAEARAFASRYGLLRERVSPRSSVDVESPAELREHYRTLWQPEIGRLLAVMNLYVDIQLALAGDVTSENALREHIIELDHPNEYGLRGLQLATYGLIAELLNEGRVDVTNEVRAFGMTERGEDITVPHLAYVTRSNTLLAVIYQSLSDLIVIERREMRYCEDCARVFLPRTGKQRFCNDTCASRTRYHRNAQRQRESAAGIDAADVRD